MAGHTQFTVLVACDLNGKCNFELGFPVRPSIPELRERIEEDVGAEASLRRGPGAGPLQMSRAQVFDERLEMWVDLTQPEQLDNFCQVYVFQSNFRDTPGRIPPPIKPLPSRHTTNYRQNNQYAPSAAYPPPGAYSAGQPGAPSAQGTRSGSGDPYADPYGGAPTGHQQYQYAPPPGHELEVQQPPLEVDSSGRDRAAHLPELPGHADKVRLVFQELDTRRARAVNQDDWRSSFERLRLTGSEDGRSPFSDDEVTKLFQSAAGSEGEGQCTYNKFQSFAELYPKLLDALYYRSRDFYADQGRQDKLKQEKERLERLQQKAEAARDEVAASEADVDGRQQAVQDAQADYDNAQERMKDATNDKKEAQEEVDKARRRRDEAKRDAQGVKEQSRKKDSEKRSFERAVASAEKNLKTKEDDLDKAEKEKERLQRALENQEKEIQKKRAEVDEARSGVQAAKDKVEEVRDPDLERDMQDKNDKVASAEEELRNATDEEAQRARALKDAQRQVQQQAHQKQAAEKDAALARSKEGQRKQLAERADRAADDQQKIVDALEQKGDDAIEKRRDQETTEAELLRIEMDVRGQREEVERKEQQLRICHRDFSQTHGRASPPRGAARHADTSGGPQGAGPFRELSPQRGTR